MIGSRTKLLHNKEGIAIKEDSIHNQLPAGSLDFHHGVILVLGSPNSDDGELYSIAKERCELAIKEYNNRSNFKLLLTGGYGKHFNNSRNLHAEYLKKHLEMKGIPKEAFIEFVESSNTLEDASLSKPIVVKHGFTDMIIITSDYHVDRASMIFEKEYSDSNVKINFSASITNEEICEIDLISLKKHEMETLKKMKKSDHNIIWSLIKQ